MGGEGSQEGSHFKFELCGCAGRKRAVYFQTAKIGRFKRRSTRHPEGRAIKRAEVDIGKLKSTISNRRVRGGLGEQGVRDRLQKHIEKERVNVACPSQKTSWG